MRNPSTFVLTRTASLVGTSPTHRGFSAPLEYCRKPKASANSGTDYGNVTDKALPLGPSNSAFRSNSVGAKPEHAGEKSYLDKHQDPEHTRQCKHQAEHPSPPVPIAAPEPISPCDATLRVPFCRRFSRVGGKCDRRLEYMPVRLCPLRGSVPGGTTVEHALYICTSACALFP